MLKGIFISFEGSEGSGKSTQIKLLKEYFEEMGRECLLCREPGGTKISEKIRELLLSKKSDNMSPTCELLLFTAARAQLVEEVIKPALAEGKVVISDRFYDSTIAYQGVARSLDMSAVKFVNDFCVNGTMPDITILLDLEASQGVARAKLRDGDNTDRMGDQKLEFYDAVRNAYLDIAKANQSRFVVINSQSGIKESFEDIKLAIQSKV
ncbi:MAG: dTMP kinase [Opitutales bacterium]